MNCMEIPMDVQKARSAKERNKVAQKKYREKLKESEAALEIRVQQLEQQLQRICQEREKLEQYNSALLSDSRQGSSPMPTEENVFVPARGFRESNHPFNNTNGIKLTMCCQQYLTHSEMLLLSFEDLVPFFEAVTAKARELLEMNPERDPNCYAGQQLFALMQEKHGLAAYVAGNMPRLLKRIRRDGEFRGLKPQIVEAIKAALNLRDNQKRYLTDNRDLLATTMTALLTERIALQEQLQHLDCQVDFTGESAARLQYEWRQITQAMQDNLDKEHVAVCRFYAMLWIPPDGIDYFQEAAMLCAAHPHFVDMLVLLEDLEAPDSRPILLDADTRPDLLLPTGRLPEPGPDRYEPVPEKMLNAIFKNGLVIRGNSLRS